MKKITFVALLVVAVPALVETECLGGRGGRVGGAGRGGFGPSGGVRPGGGVVHSYGAGSGVSGRASTPIVGPGGGTGKVGVGGGSYTTKGGSTINYGGAALGGNTPGGVQGGKYVGGIQVTTPGGKEVGKVGQGGFVSGPGGNTVAGKQGVVGGTGPQGALGAKYQGGAVIGPQGGLAGKTTVGGAVGPGGVQVGGSRGIAAGGPYGAVAGKSTAVAGTRGTYYRSAAVIRGQGVNVRQAVARYPCFRPGWYTQHPGAWFAAGWVASTAWRAATWDTCATYCSLNIDAPIYYDYGDNVVYQDDGVYFDGNLAYTTEQYAQRAADLAEAGRKAQATKDEQWLPLGVFAMVHGDDQTSNHIFQLAVNKQGIIRGNYYDAVTDTTNEVYGSVNQKTQRAAWTVGDRKTPVYEAGMANLTQDETTMVVHYGTERSQQFTLIRIEVPETEAAPPGK